LTLAAAAMCAPAVAQTITSLQSSLNGGAAANVTGITAQSNLPTGFTIYINGTPGSWDPAAPSTLINWNNVSGGPSLTFAASSVSGTGNQVQGIVPAVLFKNAVASNQTVLVSVTQIATSGTANFLIVPQPTPLGPNLPNALVGTSYSQSIVKDGTSPFQPVTIVGSPPFGINFNNAFNGLVGIPTGPPGLSSFTPTIRDFWGNPVTIPLNIQVQGTPDIGSVISTAGNSYSYGTITNLQVFVDANAVPPFAANIQFKDGAAVLGVASIVPATGQATLPNVILGFGSHPNITATYLGDTNWISVTSPALGVNVTQATPTFQLFASPYSATYGGALSTGSVLVIGAPLPAAAPTGSLTLTVGGTTVKTFPSISGLNIFTGTTLPAAVGAGPQTLTFTYSGDTNYTGNSTTAPLTVAKVLPTASLGVGTNPIVLGQNERLTATLTPPGVGVPGGNVTFADANIAIAGSTTVLTSGSGVYNTTGLAVGAHPINFTYSGDSNFLGLTSTQTIVNVISAPLSIVTTSLPSGVVSVAYSAGVVATGGQPPYSYSASGLPPGLGINAATGVISGTPQSAGAFAPTFTVTDSLSTKASAVIALSIGRPPLQIVTSSPLPDGTVGVGYSAAIGTSGGTEPVTFSLDKGSPPAGLRVLSSGLVTGTPTAPGTSTFSIRANDSANGTDARDFTLTIKPPPLSIPSGSPNPTAIAGTPFKLDFGCTGGVAPYTFSITGSLPPGITFSSCVLSGTPTTPGTYTIRIVVTDAVGATAQKDVVITVAPPTLSLPGGALPDGQVGVAYSAGVTATGGTAPITYSGGDGLPPGLTLASSGAITGTPAAVGSYSFRVTATDSLKATASGTYSILVTPPKLAFGPSSLPDGVVGTAYSGSVTGTGGTKPYSFAFSGLPDGLKGAIDGTISGTPTTAGTFTFSATLTDSADARASVTQSFSIKIAPQALVITTASAPNGTAGTPYSASFAASGGAPPYTFSASGQPATLTMSAAGTLSGTPTAPGTINLSVTAKDANGTTASKSFSFTIGLPVTPPLNFGGISATSNPLQQPRVTVSLASPFPVDLIVTLTAASVPDSGVPDPSVGFPAGPTTTITIPAGSLNGATDVPVQTGSVAGQVVITATKITAAGSDVTPSPAPKTSIRIAAAPVVIVSMTVVRTATGFTATIVGYVTDRSATIANFTFTGTNLGTTTLAVPVDTVFTGYFGGATPPSAPFGGQFTYVQQFTVNGSTTAVASIGASITGRLGASNSVTATVN
jgi:hypothetical protein